MSSIGFILCITFVAQMLFASSYDTASGFGKCDNIIRAYVLDTVQSSKKNYVFGDYDENTEKTYSLTLQDAVTKQVSTIESIFNLNKGDQIMVSYFEFQDEYMVPIQKRFNQKRYVNVNVWPKGIECYSINKNSESSLSSKLEQYFDAIANGPLLSKKSIQLFDDQDKKFFFIPPNLIVQSILNNEGKLKYIDYMTLPVSYINKDGVLVFPTQEKVTSTFKKVSK